MIYSRIRINGESWNGQKSAINASTKEPKTEVYRRKWKWMETADCSWRLIYVDFQSYTYGGIHPVAYECLFLCLKHIVQIAMKPNVARKSNALKIHTFYFEIYRRFMRISRSSCHTMFEFAFEPTSISGVRTNKSISNELKPKIHYYYHRAIWFLFGKMCANLIVCCVYVCSFIHLTMKLWFGCWVVYRLCVICLAVEHFKR